MERTKRRRALVSIVLIALAVLVVASVFFGERYTVNKAREDFLRQDLFAMRAVLDQYLMDKGKRPQSLNDLVAAGYLKEIPSDPMTGRSDTWVLGWSHDPRMPGIYNIHSGSLRRDRHGMPYSGW